MKIGIDIGGVITKYPHIFRTLINELSKTNVEVFIITDMSFEKAINLLKKNDITLPLYGNIISANYEEHGESCKTVLCKQLGIDIMIDDHMGYLAEPTGGLRLFTMPDTNEPYFHDDWKNDDAGTWGRRKKPEWKSGI